LGIDINMFKFSVNACCRPWLTASFGLALIALVAGCGGEDGPALVSVSGTVLENGKPVSGASVMFSPTGGDERRPGEDVTGPEGNYLLRTTGRFGVEPGKYHVVVTKLPPTPEASGNSAQFQDDPFMASLSANGPGGGRKKKVEGPVEFTFEEEVSQDSKQVIDFDLKGKSTAAEKKS